MTFAAHRKRSGGVGYRNETGRVSFGLVSFRRISAVATIASDARVAMSACSIERHRFARRAALLAVTGDAIVRGLRIAGIAAASELARDSKKTSQANDHR